MKYAQRPIIIERDIDVNPSIDVPMDWMSGLILLTITFAVGLGMGLVLAGHGSGLFGKLV